MKLKEKQITSLKRQIENVKDILERNSEKLKKLEKELEMAEIEELKTVLIQNGMTVEDIIKNISVKTENIINEKKFENKIKTLEEKKNVEF